MNNNDVRKFLFYWVLSISLTVSLVGLLNYAVDPYGLYRTFEFVGGNQQKEGVRNKIRFVKALELPLRRPKTIILGSSRVHDGINPDNPILKEDGYSPAYNLGVDMSRIHESLQYLKHALANSEVKRVIIGLDFFMFNASQKVNYNFDSSLVGRRIESVDYITNTIFSTDAFMDSVRTLKISHSQPGRMEFLANGYRPGSSVFYKLKNYEALHRYTNFIFLSSQPNITKYYSDFSLDQEVFDDFERILKICQDNQIDIKLYISPAHANLDGEGIWAAEKWGMMEEWKKRVTLISNRYGVAVWDFSGYNSITTEEVLTPMKNYWDSSHFTERVGNMIIARIFDKVEFDIPSDFGVKLTSNNIDAHLISTKRNRLKYIEMNAHDHKSLIESYKYFLSGGQIDPENSAGIF